MKVYPVQDLTLVVLFGLMFFFSHQIYCQNDLDMLIYRMMDGYGIGLHHQLCYPGLEFGNIRNWLPDALWAFMIVTCLTRLWLPYRNHLWFWLSCLVLATGFELMQLLGMAKGTFDIFDVLVSALAAGISLLVIHFLYSRIEVEE